MSPLAYLRAFWNGQTSGMAEVLGWVGLVLLGIALAALIAVALCALVRYLERHESLPATDDELTPWTPAERRARSRDLSVITVLALACPAVIALTR